MFTWLGFASHPAKGLGLGWDINFFMSFNMYWETLSFHKLSSYTGDFELLLISPCTGDYEFLSFPLYWKLWFLRGFPCNGYFEFLQTFPLYWGLWISTNLATLGSLRFYDFPLYWRLFSRNFPMMYWELDSLQIFLCTGDFEFLGLFPLYRKLWVWTKTIPIWDRNFLCAGDFKFSICPCPVKTNCCFV